MSFDSSRYTQRVRQNILKHSRNNYSGDYHPIDLDKRFDPNSPRIILVNLEKKSEEL